MLQPSQFLIFSEQWIISKYCVIFQPCLHISCYNSAGNREETAKADQRIRLSWVLTQACATPVSLLPQAKLNHNDTYLAVTVHAAQLPNIVLTRLRVASSWKNHKPAQGPISSRAHVHPARYLQAGNHRHRGLPPASFLWAQEHILQHQSILSGIW